MGATVKEYGTLTTPQLHHIVRMTNSTDPSTAKWRSEDGYYAMLLESYRDLLQVQSSNHARLLVKRDSARYEVSLERSWELICERDFCDWCRVGSVSKAMELARVVSEFAG